MKTMTIWKIGLAFAIVILMVSGGYMTLATDKMIKNANASEAEIDSSSAPKITQNIERTRAGSGIYFVTGTIADYGYVTGQDSRYLIYNAFSWLWPNFADSGSILLIWDSYAWGDSWRRHMNNQGISYTQKSANQLSSNDFNANAYRMIIISEYQPSGYLSKMESMVGDMENYVNGGGVLVDMIGTNNNRRWSGGAAGPFGVRTNSRNNGQNYVVDTNHGMVQNMRTPYFTGSSASHAEISTEPEGSTPLLTVGTGSGGAVVASWLEAGGGERSEYGGGHVIMKIPASYSGYMYNYYRYYYGRTYNYFYGPYTDTIQIYNYYRYYHGNYRRSYKYRGFVKWDTSQIPDDINIISASMKYYCSYDYNDPRAYVRELNYDPQQYSGSTLWNYMGQGTVLNSNEDWNRGNWLEHDISNKLSQIKSKGWYGLSFRMTDEGGSTQRQGYCDGYNRGSTAPVIEITYTEPRYYKETFSQDFLFTDFGKAWTNTTSDPVNARNERVDTGADEWNENWAAYDDSVSCWRMDQNTTQMQNLNELILHIGVTDISSLSMTFATREWGFNNQDIMPESFQGQVNADGIAVSNDGVTWYRLWQYPTNVDSWTEYTLDLVNLVPELEFDPKEDLYIKFQQYGFNPIPMDGIAWDEIYFESNWESEYLFEVPRVDMDWDVDNDVIFATNQGGDDPENPETATVTINATGLGPVDNEGQVFMLRGYGYGDLFSYDIMNNTWDTKAGMPRGVYSYGGNNKMIYDGRDAIYAMPQNGYRYFYKYTVSTNTWTQLRDLPDWVYYSPGLAYDGNNYIYCHRGDSSQFWRYDIAQDQWSTMASQQVYYRTSSIVYAKGYVFVNYGYGSRNFYIYDVDANQWSSGASMPYDARYGASLTYDGDDTIWYLQGYYEYMYKYTISSNTWSNQVSRFPRDVDHGGDILHDGDQYIYGITRPGYRYLYRMDTETLQWSQLADMPQYHGYGSSLVYVPPTSSMNAGEAVEMRFQMDPDLTITDYGDASVNGNTYTWSRPKVVTGELWQPTFVLAKNDAFNDSIGNLSIRYISWDGDEVSWFEAQESINLKIRSINSIDLDIDDGHGGNRIIANRSEGSALTVNALDQDGELMPVQDFDWTLEMDEINSATLADIELNTATIIAEKDTVGVGGTITLHHKGTGRIYTFTLSPITWGPASIPMVMLYEPYVVGVKGIITVTIHDDYHNVVMDYSGTMKMVIRKGEVEIEYADTYEFMGLKDKGTHTFIITPMTWGPNSTSLYFEDRTMGIVSDVSVFSVVAGPVRSLNVQLDWARMGWDNPTSGYHAGDPLHIVVTGRDGSETQNPSETYNKPVMVSHDSAGYGQYEPEPWKTVEGNVILRDWRSEPGEHVGIDAYFMHLRNSDGEAIRIFKAGVVTLTLKSTVDHSITGTITITVLPTYLDTIVATPGGSEANPEKVEVILAGSQRFEIKGYDRYENEVIIDPEMIDWSVDSNINKIGRGTFMENAPVFNAVEYFAGPYQEGGIHVDAMGPRGAVARLNITVRVLNDKDVWLVEDEIQPESVLVGQPLKLQANIHYHVPAQARVGNLLEIKIRFSLVTEDGDVIVELVEKNVKLTDLNNRPEGIWVFNTTLPAESFADFVKKDPDNNPLNNVNYMKVELLDAVGGADISEFEITDENNEVTVKLYAVIAGKGMSSPSFAPSIMAVGMALLALAIGSTFYSGRRKRKYGKDKDAVSPVIAIILMVAITIVLAGVLWLWVSGLVATGKDDPMYKGFSVEWGGRTVNKDYELQIKAVDTKNVLSVEDLRFTLYSSDRRDMSNGQHKATNVYGKPIDDQTFISFRDGDHDGMLSIGDRFLIKSTEHVDDDGSTDSPGLAEAGFFFEVRAGSAKIFEEQIN